MTQTEVDNPQLPIFPPLLPLAALIAAIVLDLTPLHFLAAPIGLNPQVIVGVLVAAGGVWLNLGASARFIKEGTNVNPLRPSLKIVRSGAYRFTRNPMYLGFVVFLLGLSLIFSLEWGLILTPVLWLALDQLIVVREEAYLRRKFGTDYEVLLQSTRRWL